jgi:hypothetical protein
MLRSTSSAKLLSSENTSIPLEVIKVGVAVEDDAPPRAGRWRRRIEVRIVYQAPA